MEKQKVKVKVCLAGEPMVGKTSLIRRYVLDDYDDRYIATLGTKVSKMVLNVPDPTDARSVEVRMILWDVMGTRTLRDLLRDAYYHGAHAILGVADLTRGETLAELSGWFESIRAVAGPIPSYVVVNKADLESERAKTHESIDGHCGSRGWPWSYTSAKTGEGVEDAFRNLVSSVLRARMRPVT